jgi:hypothetical protein
MVLGLVASLGCGQNTAKPAAASAALSKSAEKYLRVPTDGGEGSNAESGQGPAGAVLPFGTRIPAGTALMVRLLEPLSSANARAGQVFEGTVDEDVVLDGQLLMERGTRVRGQVVESAARRPGRTPGYLRLTLTEVAIEGKARPVRTYSDFFKGAGAVRRSVANAFPGERLVAETAVLSRDGAAGAEEGKAPEVLAAPKPADVQLSVDRRLTFHLLEPISLFPGRAHPISVLRP